MERLKFIDNIDPKAIEDVNFTYNINCFPVSYLVFGASPFSVEDITAYKTLFRYNQLLKGWVVDVKTLVIKSDIKLVKGKVRSLYNTFH